MVAALRMKDLVEATGTSREAIRFYINEGLLPEPRKTSRNMAWYSPEHVERIRYIKALQEEHFLPLKAIRAVLDGAGEFTDHQLHQFEVLRQRISAEHSGDAAQPVHPLVVELGLTPDDERMLHELGFVAADGSVGPDGEELLRLWARMREEGLTPERGFNADDVRIVQEAVDVVFANELKIFTERLGGMTDEEVSHILDRIIPAVNRAFALLHERKLRHFLERLILDSYNKTGDAP